jgi:glycosyltransferase involved in cell wall biosynthesis
VGAGNYQNNGSVQKGKKYMGLRIGILGTRGVPNSYGGFEHFAAYLSRGLVEKGHQVTVYNSSKHPYQRKKWYGVNIIHCFDPEYIIGVPGQFIYDLNCILDARKRKYDIILMLGYTSSSVWGFLYPKKSIVITNMDGLEWQRTKYSNPVKKFLKYAEKLAVQSSRFHVADSPVIKEYLDHKYNIKSKYIAYGAGLHPAANETFLAEYELKKYEYFLLMARMEPENNIEMILDGYCLTTSAIKFIVIGNTSNGFGKYLVGKYKNESRIVFLGAIFDEQKVESITSFCSLYFHGHSVGGTNPSLLDAMAAKVPLAVHNNPFNRSIIKQNALLFTNTTDVCNLINANQYADAVHINNNYSAITNEFTWKMVIDQYENYFFECYPAYREYYPLKHEKSILYKEQY